MTDFLPAFALAILAGCAAVFLLDGLLKWYDETADAREQAKRVRLVRQVMAMHAALSDPVAVRAATRR